MNDEQLLRYSRQLLLPEVDIAGQEKLLSAKVLILGLGGLGAPAALYLAAAGVGHLVLADFDHVDLTNLQRQIIHTTARVDQPKVLSAEQALRELNPDIKITCVEQRLEGEALRQQVEQVDLALDCSDNFRLRFDLNAACVATRTPLVSGAAVRLEGQVAVFDSRQTGSPCYRCLYVTQTQDNLTCAANGVLGPVVGLVGSMQALEAIKLLVGFGTSLAGRVLLFDARHSQWRELKLARDPECPVCGRD